ncbi:hypothetical protein SISNIDRAFT_489929 [Sistotremastrum niveocremeum HHB9708]|uniref:Arrestin-like N-terminal domain-containing protein n=1 Tax=Sistotremastrum niveocremeum HHB9708 TaxID=1314777 RepID=A0A164PFW8_9AGAM|nr:hypothetical protein SISNIDRAFT_489929 [Sistotremastrum niveocremeum HHB9708]
MTTSRCDVFSLEMDDDLRIPGSMVSGFVDINLSRAFEKKVKEVSVMLVGEVTTRVSQTGFDTSTSEEERKSFIEQRTSLWELEKSPPPFSSSSDSNILSIPFAFEIPDESLPPSFWCSTAEGCAFVKYFVKVTAFRDAWYNSNVSISRPFPFTPFDDSVLLTDSAISCAARGKHTAQKLMRKGALFGGRGKVEVDFFVPGLPVMPQLQSIPVTVAIRCFSKPLSSSHSKDPSKFTFPKPPACPREIALYLTCVCDIRAQHYEVTSIASQKPIGCFGKPAKRLPDDALAERVRVAVEEPVWYPDEQNSKEGRWGQAVELSTEVVLCCSSSFDVDILKVNYQLDLKISFDGFDNELEMTIPLGPVSSGLYRDQPHDHLPKLDLPPGYWEVVQVVEGKSAAQ